MFQLCPSAPFAKRGRQCNIGVTAFGKRKISGITRNNHGEAFKKSCWQAAAYHCKATQLPADCNMRQLMGNDLPVCAFGRNKNKYGSIGQSKRLTATQPVLANFCEANQHCWKRKGRLEKRFDIALSFEHISPNLSARRIIGLL